MTTDSSTLRRNDSVPFREHTRLGVFLPATSPVGLSVFTGAEWFAARRERSHLNEIVCSELLDRSSRRKEAPFGIRESEFQPPHVGRYEVPGRRSKDREKGQGKERAFNECS